MANLTYTEFLEELERRLESLSVDDFKNIFLKKARKVHPDLRCEFLAQVNKSGMEDSSRLNCDAIMAELAAFIQRLEDGDYCSGWEWDPVYQEEREWGDESWVGSLAICLEILSAPTCWMWTWMSTWPYSAEPSISIPHLRRERNAFFKP